jgi:ribosomal protein S18 acetylase RimI-like enzyme
MQIHSSTSITGTAVRSVPDTARSSSVRLATLADEPRVTELIVSAFETDPAARWMYPDVWDYRVHFPEFVRAFGGGAFATGTAHVLQSYNGTALWLPPGAHPDDEALRALIASTTPEELQPTLMALFEEMGRYHPPEPHWHLPTIGIHPSHQRQGYGAALLRYALRLCDEERAAAYLESSNPENIPLYERHGFEVLGRIQLGSSPVITPMLRRPRLRL